jgi:hypothetical protein
VDRSQRPAAILAVAALALVIAACGGAATPIPQSEAEAATCAALQAFNDEVRELAGLDPSTASIEDWKAQRLVVSQAWDDVQASLPGLEAANSAAVEAGQEAVEAALTDIPTDVPISDAIAAAKAATDQLRSAFQEMADGLGCAIVTPY